MQNLHPGGRRRPSPKNWKIWGLKFLVPDAPNRVRLDHFFPRKGDPPLEGVRSVKNQGFLKEAPWTAILTPENRIERFDPRTRVRDRVFENIL